MMKVIEEGKKVYGYKCPFCGRKVLSTERLEPDLTCKNCGNTMEQTNLDTAVFIRQIESPRTK